MAESRKVSKQVEYLTQTLRDARQLMQINERMLQADCQSRQQNAAAGLRQREHSTDVKKSSAGSDQISDIRKQLEVLKEQVKLKEELRLQEELEQLSQHLKQNCGGRGVNHQVPLRHSHDKMNHRPNCECNCISQQYLYEGKVREMEKELSKLSKCIFDTQQTMKDQELQIRKAHESIMERDFQIEKCQDLIVKLECELSEALENVKQLCFEKMELSSKVADKDKAIVSLQHDVNKLTKTNETLCNTLDMINIEEEKSLSYREPLVCNEAEPVTCIHVSSPRCTNNPGTVSTATCNCCHSPKQNDASEKEQSIIDEERQTIALLQDQVYALKIQLLDEKSVTEVMRQQNQLAIEGHQQLGSDLTKSLEDSEKLRRKYIKAKKHFEEEAALLEEKITQAHCQEIQNLREELMDKERSFSEELKERETLLLIISREIDSLILILDGQSTVNTEALVGRFIPTDVMSKLRWVWKELTSLKKEEQGLRKSLDEQKDVNIMLQAKVRAFNDEVMLSLPKDKGLLHQSF